MAKVCAFVAASYIKQKHNYEIISRQLETILEEAIKEKHNGTKHK